MSRIRQQSLHDMSQEVLSSIGEQGLGSPHSTRSAGSEHDGGDGMGMPAVPGKVLPGFGHVVARFRSGSVGSTKYVSSEHLSNMPLRSFAF